MNKEQLQAVYDLMDAMEEMPNPQAAPERVQAFMLGHIAINLDRIANCLETSNIESEGISSLNRIAEMLNRLCDK